MRKPLWAAFAAAALCLTAPVSGGAGVITFDEQYVGGLPVPVSYQGLASSPWNSLTPLTEAYAPMGVHFAGPDWASGGVIVNDPPNFSPYGGPDQYGFGVLPHSGQNVLAFNRNAVIGNWWTGLGTASDPETISFDDPQSAVSIWAAGGWKGRKFTLEAFDGIGDLLASDSLTTQDWSQLSVSASGIQYVTLTETGHWWDSWVYDDLSFTADTSVTVNGDGSRSPEPAGLVLAGLGGLGLVGWRWRRRKTADGNVC